MYTYLHCFDLICMKFIVIRKLFITHPIVSNSTVVFSCKPSSCWEWTHIGCPTVLILVICSPRFILIYSSDSCFCRMICVFTCVAHGYTPSSEIESNSQLIASTFSGAIFRSWLWSPANNWKFSHTWSSSVAGYTPVFATSQLQSTIFVLREGGGIATSHLRAAVFVLREGRGIAQAS